MNDVHAMLMPFVDGELNTGEREQFRAHLAGCPSCQTELAELLQLKAIEAQGRRPKIVLLRGHAWKAGLAIALAAGIGFATVLRAPDPAELAFDDAPTRSIEPRLSFGPASKHRPYDTLRSGPARAENLPLAALARLEAQGDKHALGVAWLVRGDAARAIQELDRAGESAAVFSDRAAAQLVAGALGPALAAADRALELQPRHAPALFNRALILERMSLTRAAAEDFTAAAATEREADTAWATEAKERAAALRARERDAEALGFVQTLLDTVAGRRALELSWVERAPDQAYEIYILALLAAADPQELARLEPIAAALDRALSTEHARAAFQQAKNTAPARFAVAPEFRAFAVTLAKLSPQADALRIPEGASPVEDPAKFLAAIMKKGAADQIAAAIFYYRERAEHEAEWKKAITAAPVEYFSCAAGWAAFTYDWLGGKSSELAERELSSAIAACGRAKLARNELRAETVRANVVFFSRDLVRAADLAAKARARAKKLPDLRLEVAALEVLFHVAGYRHDRASMRAYGRELIAADPRPERVRALSEELANEAIFSVDFAGARRELAAAEHAGGTLSLVGAFVLADLYRLEGRAEDRARVEAAIEAQREELAADAATMLLVRHVLALARLRDDRAGALAELRAIIIDARAMPGDATARSAEAYTVSLLALEAGRDGRFEDALRWIAEEQQLELPSRCTLAIEAHLERKVAAARDAEGKFIGALDTTRSEEVPASIQDALAGCEELVVAARPALHGRSGLLRRTFAYRFATGARRPAAAPSREALFVFGALSPARAGLAPLSPLSAEHTEGGTILAGAAATPSAVREAMARAGWIELHAHGQLYGDSDAAGIALSEDADGHYRLLAESLKPGSLRGAPIVLLGACEAADIRREDLLEPYGLPIAFLRAGARGVLAADKKIPDREVARVFAALRRKIDAGATLPAALKAVRLEAGPPADGPEARWIDALVAFEGFGGGK